MSADPGPAFRPGQSVAAYRIERLLGSGGMGAVVQAYDTTLHRRVALKVLTGHTSGDTARTQLLREARSAASLSHPNICTIYEVGEVDGCAFIAMEYVDGRSVRSRLDEGALPPDELVRYGVQAADALAWAHERGVVHRDFKAANVIVTGDGRIKVVDFGLARRSDPMMQDATTMLSIAAPGTVLGTPYAMAPEQVRGEPADPRTDIWALGVLLYEMATGAQPFTGASVPEIFSAVLRDAPAPHRALTPGLQRIVGRCLEKDPAARYQQAHEVRAALGVLQSASAPAPQSVDHRRRVSPALAVSAGLAAVLAILLGFSAGTIRDRFAGGATRGGPATLAVLPLVNMTSDPDQQPFIDGLTEQLARSLGRSDPKALRVVASALSMPHAGSNRPIAAIARELEADHVLRGSVTRAGDRVGVTVELIRASDNRQLWKDSYDRRMSELFKLDRDISGAVSLALDVAPGVNNPAPASETRAVDPAAFDLYLRGVSHTLRTNEPDLDQAIALLEQSAAIDPTFQSTQAYLALAYGNKSSTYRPNDPIWEEKGFAAAQKALLLDPDSPEAHYAQAVVLWRPSHAFPSKEALAELRKALAVRQNFDEAWHQYGVILMHIGHLDEAVPAFERAVQLNPSNTLARFRFGPVRIYQLQFEEALAAINRVPPDTFPAQWTYQRAWALLSLGRLDEARTLIDRALVDNPADQGGVLHSARGMLRAMAGNRRGAEADIAEAIRVGKSFLHFHHTAYAIGAIYTRLGDMDRAQEWIENAANDGFPNFTYFETDPHLERLRAVPRFKAFLAKLRQEWEHIPGVLD